MIFLGVASATGMVCGIVGFAAWQLVPISIVFALLSTAVAKALGLSAGLTCVYLLACVALLQSGYLVSALVSDLIPVRRGKGLLSPFQKAIAEEIGLYFALPVDTPPQLAEKILKLQHMQAVNA